ncbi:phospholipid carrier-dependent glycosyltransferase [Agromyces sp. CFH 90414]|uniref:Polyprenol-phosphate-mannose--protein mannosyltransferase n=1 Tax=Agromyces agglutinans TaxID=2662258 RepID=A0A6I2F5W9_9MICO|nr:phospholipid carrier-dependent glycosyltransferase [Agromyces agglutinans]MRG60865.1 phospholipid carrier-dependent glycosyltransferase [Agromyces agglutinans]
MTADPATEAREPQAGSDADADAEPAPEAPPEASEPRGTRLDAWWAGVLADPRRRALWYWGGPILVTLLAAALRFWGLGHPQQVVFDETYYVKDAWTLWQNGYESTWPEGSDEAFADGDSSGFSDDPSYVVHPPLGKWLIGLGMAAFGTGDAFWWRASTALAGTIAVFVVTMLARRFTGTTVVAVIAGLLFAVDGNAIVMSRVALLDNWLMLWCLLGVWFVVLDRDRSWRLLEHRLASAAAEGREPGYGPALWARLWVFAAGAAFGAATAVKWSGLWFLAAFGLYLVVADALARRRAGVPFWITGALLKQAPISFLLLVPVAGAVYLASWAGWILTDGGYARDWADDPANRASGFFEWVPLWAQSLWHYHQSAYSFHIGVHGDHPWQSNPLTWLFMIRPTNMYYRDVEGCGDTCAESIIGLGNPLIWWAAAVAVIYLVIRLVRFREWQVGVVLLGLAAGYLPWLGYLDRTVFQFYSIVFQPYLVLALAIAIGIVLGRRDDATWRRERGIATVAVFLVGVIAVSAWFYPIWTGMPIDPVFRRLHFWLPSWG